MTCAAALPGRPERAQTHIRPGRDSTGPDAEEDQMDTTGVVVGVDGSDPGRQAVRWAAAEAQRRSSRLRVVAAYRAPWPAEEFAAGTELDTAALARAEELVADMVTHAREVSPGTLVSGLAVCGAPVPVLNAAASDGSLIVVGDRGHGGFASLLLGSTGLQLATHAAGPVVVVRGRVEPDAGRIVVGTDGSPGAEIAVQSAFGQAATRGCPLTVVHAYRAPTPRWGQHPHPVDLDGEHLQAAELTVLRTSIEPWREKFPHVPVEESVTYGDPAAVLITMSATADLVVVGTRGHGGFTGLLLGSVGQKHLHHADCPVLIAR
jgi:nucleotide-binding universal stress UspA family protein